MLISDLGRLCHRHSEFRFEQRISTVILSTANGMFLLALLYMKPFKVKLNALEVEYALKKLPKGYDYTYESNMERINTISTANPNDNTSAIAVKVLSWVVCAYRPLSMLELQHALAIDLNNGFSTLAIYDKETLLDITARLVTVDSAFIAIPLVPLTAQEYFNHERESWFPNAFAFIIHITLKYLSRPCVAEPFENFPEDQALTSGDGSFYSLCMLISIRTIKHSIPGRIVRFKRRF